MTFPARSVGDPGCQQNWEYLGRTAPAMVTSLPGSPRDGQEVYFLASATSGVVWHLRYRAGSASAYKWEYVGGAPLYDVQTGSTTRAVSTYGDLAAGAATIFTLALAGDYLIELGANLAPGSAGNGMFMSFSVSGATALDSDAALAYFGAGTAPGAVNVANVAVKPALPAGTTIQAKFKAQGATAGTVDRRYMRIIPVRVS